MMQALKERARHDFVREYYDENKNLPKSSQAQALMSVGTPKSTTYRYLNRLNNGENLGRKPGSGPKPPKHFTDEKKAQMILKAKTEMMGFSFRSLAKEFKISPGYVKLILNQNHIFRHYRQTTPHYDEKQEKVVKKRLRRLRNGPFQATNDEILVIMDDESYFDENGMSFSGNKYYFAEEGSNVLNDIKYRSHSKYPFKVLVWVAISIRGRSQFFIKLSKGAVDQVVYKEEMLKKRLLPFIKRHHSDGKFIFWPDLASSHYAKTCQQFMNEKGINFLPRESNPPNCPQLRPIEQFWYEMKCKVYAAGWRPKTKEDLIERIKIVAKKMTKNVCERLMKGVTRKCRKADKDGVRSVCY